MLTCNNINKSYGIDPILIDISFKVDKNDRIGIVGRNGAGKSTLFKIITQNIDIDTGEIFINKDLSIGYLSQDLNLNGNSTVYEEMLTVFEDIMALEKEISKYQKMMSTAADLDGVMKKYTELVEEFERIDGYQYQSRIRGILIGLGFSEEDGNKIINTLSGGQKTRIALGKLLLLRPQLFLLDEPTNYLDMSAIAWLEGYLKNYDGALMIISHDRYFLDAVVHKIFEIENHRLTAYNGNYSTYVERKRENLETTLHHYELQQKEIERQEEIIKRFRQFNREKSVRKAESREKALEKMDLIDKPIIFKKKAKIRFEPQVQSGKIVLEMSDLSKSFGSHCLFKDINLNIIRGEKVGIIGANGTGKSTLLNIISGALPLDSGDIILGHNVNIGFFHQENEDLTKTDTILSEVWKALPTANEGEIRDFLARFMFTGEDVYKTIDSLSGGEVSRVSLAKLMLSKSNFLLMDEPTNHLDMETKDILEDALVNYGGTILLISHDRYFLNRVADKLIVLENQSIRIYNGNYDYYIQRIEQEAVIASLKEETPKVTKTQIISKKKQENLQKHRQKSLRKEIERLEEEIGCLEGKIKEYEALMCQENFYDDYDNVSKITKEYDETKSDLDDILEEWTEKQIELEGS